MFNEWRNNESSLPQSCFIYLPQKPDSSLTCHFTIFLVLFMLLPLFFFLIVWLSKRHYMPKLIEVLAMFKNYIYARNE